MDYGHLENEAREIASEEYVKVAHMNHLDVTTQHLIGGIAKWEKTETGIKAVFQIRVAKVKWTDETCATELAKANAHGIVTSTLR